MRQQRIVYVLGTPANSVKIAPVIARLRARLPLVRHAIVTTDQDYDGALFSLFQKELDVPEPSYSLDVDPGGRASKTAQVMERLERVIELERPAIVIVSGDLDSTLAATLTAAQLGVPTAHVESGLRSFDRGTPEEVNRIVADEFAALLFADSEEAVDNLAAQGIDDDRVHLVGNTMVDALMAVEGRFREAKAAQRFGVSPGGYLLVLLNGSTLVDSPAFWTILDRLKALSRELPVVFPLGRGAPRVLERYPGRPAVQLVERPGYLDLLSLEADAAAVLTDSGEVQDETTFLGVACFTLCNATERSTTLDRGTNTLLGPDPSRIREILPALKTKRPAVEPPPLWDGQAADRLAEVLEAALEDGQRSTRRPVGQRQYG
jgi:UDP-N-acetylglucosamine 2-epimerase (non-hydrolysing)